MRGSALDTTVLDSIATNMASRRPLSASRIWRWVIWPDSSAEAGAETGAGDAWDTEARFTIGRRLPTATIFPDRCHQQPNSVWAGAQREQREGVVPNDAMKKRSVAVATEGLGELG